MDLAVGATTLSAESGCTPGSRRRSSYTIGTFGWFSRIASIVLLAMPAFAGEYVILSSGLRLHIDLA